MGASTLVTLSFTILSVAASQIFRPQLDVFVKNSLGIGEPYSFIVGSAIIVIPAFVASFFVSHSIRNSARAEVPQ